MVNVYLSQKQRWMLAILLLAQTVLLVIIYLMESKAIYFEPTTEAIARARAAYPIIVASLIAALIGSIVTCILSRKRTWLYVLAPMIGILSMFTALTNNFFVQFMVLAAIPIFVALSNEIRTNKPTGKIGVNIMSMMTVVMLALACCYLYVTLSPSDQTGIIESFLSFILFAQLSLTKSPLVFLAPALAVYTYVKGIIFFHRDQRLTRRVVIALAIGGLSTAISLVGLYLMIAG